MLSTALLLIPRIKSYRIMTRLAIPQMHKTLDTKVNGHEEAVAKLNDAIAKGREVLTAAEIRYALASACCVSHLALSTILSTIVICHKCRRTACGDALKEAAKRTMHGDAPADEKRLLWDVAELEAALARLDQSLQGINSCISLLPFFFSRVLPCTVCT
jgi:hypothetical protein